MKNIESFISKSEQRGREDFQKLCDKSNWCKLNRFSTNITSRWDVSYVKNSLNIIGEIKKRRNSSEDYDYWFAEVDKLISLFEIAVKSELKTGTPTKIAYINSFSDNKIAIWYLDEEELLNYPIETIEMQKNDWSGEKKYKQVYNLPLNKSEIYEI